MTRICRLLTSWMLALPLTFGCSSDDEPETGTLAGAEGLGGIYSVNTFTRNETSCDAEGPSAMDALGGATLLLGVVETFAGLSLLSFYACIDQNQCRELHAKVVNKQPFAYTFGVQLSEGSGMSFSGQTIMSGHNGAEGCVGGGMAQQTAVLDGDTLRIERRTSRADPYPEEEGYCTTDGARSAVEGKPCSSLEVMTATRLGSL